MELMAGYKQTDLGPVPEEWDVVPMGYVSDCLIGLTYSPMDVRDFGTLVLRSSNVQDSRLIFEDNVYVEMDIPPRAITQKDDILICVRNGSRQLIGKCTLIDEQTAGSAFGAFMSVLRSNSPQFLLYQFQSAVVKRQINEVMGATINQITNKDLATFKVIWPSSKAEQETIAEALSDADALIESLDQHISKKRNLKQAAMQQLLTGQTRLPGFSGAWTDVKIGDVADPTQEWSFTGGPFGSNLKSSDYADDGVRVIQLQNIGDGEFHSESAIFTSGKKADELISCNIYPGEIILSKMGDPVARACLIPDLHDRYLMCSDGIRLAVDKKRFDTYFVFAQINAPDFRVRANSSGTGSTRKRIGLTELRSLTISCPSVTEQTAISTILSDMATELAELESRLTKARHIKQGMMQELLTGRIRLL